MAEQFLSHSEAGDRLGVLFVIGALDVAGSERQMVYLAEGLAARGHRVGIALLDHAGHLEDVAEAAGVELHRIYQKAKSAPVRLFLLVKLIRTLRPHVVHPYLPRENGMCTLIKPFTKKATLVWGIRSSDMDWSRYSRATRILWPILIRASRFADLIIANSHAGAEHHIRAGYPREKVTVIPNGIDTEMFKPDVEAGLAFRASIGIDPETPLVGVLGRFDPMKGQDEFLESFAKLARRNSEAHAILAGSHTAQQFAEYRQRVNDLGLIGRVLILPATDRPSSLLNALTVLALPSLSEGFPNVVLEALACGTPCVAFDVGDVGLLQSDEVEVLETRDQDEFAEALSKYIDGRRRPRDVDSLPTSDTYSVGTLVVVSESALLQVVRGSRTR